MTSILAALLGAVALLPVGAQERGELVELRNRGLAELENEKPALAEETFSRFTELAPEEPLGWANLAIAKLRQQDFDGAREALAKALTLTPEDPRLLAIQGEIAHWSGQAEAALVAYRAAAAAAPDDRQLQYALYRQATIMEGSEADEAARQALDRLARLRPENLVVLLQLGQKGRASGDRAQATEAFLRVRELIWQAPPGADRILDQVLQGLEAGDLEGVRVPAQRLENVLKITPMYRESLRELTAGIQGTPLEGLGNEPPVTGFGEPAEVRFESRRIGDRPVLDVVAADFDGDGTPEVVSLIDGESRKLRLETGAEGPPTELDAGASERLLIADLDNDGRLDLLGHGPERVVFWRRTETGFAEVTESFGLQNARATAATVIDFDIEGDLDLFTAAGQAQLYRNALAGPLEPVGDKSLPPLEPTQTRDATASDLDRDGDLDLLLVDGGGLTLLDNLRQGRFAAGTDLGVGDGWRRIATGDFDNDGLPDLAAVGRGAGLWRNTGDRSFQAFPMAAGLASSAEMADLAVFDADNDGRLDLAVGGAGGLAVAAQRRPGELSFLPVNGAPTRVSALAAADLDRDGDLDLLAGGQDGLFRLDNQGGNANHWLQVRLRGLDKGNSKNNLFGLGSTLEVRAGAAYQFREAQGDVTHFGLGQVESPDLLRVVWTNGVPQNRLEPTPDQWIVEEQLLKGSCPFLYTWTGEGFEFATDLLWGAPIGLPAGEGQWVGSDPAELVKIERIEARHGHYELRITEELWEAAFFDATRLWVVDHPAELEVSSSLKILPGQAVPEKVLGSRSVQPVTAAWDAGGREVTARVARRDEIYADGWQPSRYQGVTAEPWALTFDLGAAPGAPVRLLLDGWIFPTDASLNLALDQRSEPAPLAPRLEIETGAGWRTLMPAMGFPAGKTKTMVVDTPPLPDGARRLRIVSSQWLSWDRIAWTRHPDDGTATVRARLEPATAELRYRGFSRLVRQAPNAPHTFDYDQVETASPWIPFPGRYTRYGDVRELLAAVDDRSVILGPGDEMVLVFDASDLPPPPAGWRRTLFLESHGWDKDADRNTGAGQSVEPLPFRAMSRYPYGPEESFPEGPLHRSYREEWLTRIVAPPPPPLSGDGTAVPSPR